MRNKWIGILVLGWTLLGLSVMGQGSVVAAQSTATPQPTTTPLWEINQNLCPVDKRCGQMWRISPDGQKLFLYTPENGMLYALSHDSSIPTQSYDLTNLFPSFQDQYFDFLPINDHILVYFDQERNRLASVDLTTQENRAYVVEAGMRSCTSNIAFYPPFHAFYLLPDGHTLIVCRVDEADELLHISKIDLETNELEDILVLEHVGYPYGYVRIIAGLDGAIYIEPAAGDFWAIIPGYSFPQVPGRYLARWDAGTSSWSFLRITEPLLTSGDNLPPPPSFIGVDSESNFSESRK